MLFRYETPILHKYEEPQLLHLFIHLGVCDLREMNDMFLFSSHCISYAGKKFEIALIFGEISRMGYAIKLIEERYGVRALVTRIYFHLIQDAWQFQLSHWLFRGGWRRIRAPTKSIKWQRGEDPEMESSPAPFDTAPLIAVHTGYVPRKSSPEEKRDRSRNMSILSCGDKRLPFGSPYEAESVREWERGGEKGAENGREWEESLNDLGMRATLGANYRPAANYQVEAPIYRRERLPESSENRPAG